MWLFPIDINIINYLKYGWIMNNQDPYTSRELGSWMGLDSQDPYTPRGFEIWIDIGWQDLQRLLY